VCFTHGAECTRCHGRNTLPGLRLNCRGSRGEAAAYAAALALWQRRVIAQADVILVPSRFAVERLRALGAPLPWERVRVLAPPLRAAGGAGAERAALAADSEARTGRAGEAAARDAGVRTGAYALVVSRLAPEKGVDVAIRACRAAGIALVVAGEGPDRRALEAIARDGDVRFAGRVDDAELARLRAGASIALAPSRAAETFGMAIAEAMAAGLPVAGSRVGALPELLEPQELAEAGDAGGLAEAIGRLAGDRAAGERARARVARVCAPEVVAAGLAEAYRAAGAA